MSTFRWPISWARGSLRWPTKLGPLLWQLPPMLGFDAERMRAFFDLLPRTTSHAAQLAEGHDERLTDRAFTTTDAERPLRHAVEVRHKGYLDPAFLDLLRDQDIAIVVADTAGTWPRLETVTSDFAYVRLHGDEELYVSGYSDPALDRWAELLHGWRTGQTTPDGAEGARELIWPACGHRSMPACRFTSTVTVLWT